jgi:hypothetical protein
MTKYMHMQHLPWHQRIIKKFVNDYATTMALSIMFGICGSLVYYMISAIVTLVHACSIN